MRARLTLTAAILAVLSAFLLLVLAPGVPSASARDGAGRGWFRTITSVVERELQLIARDRAAQRAVLAQVAEALTTPPPPPPPPPSVDDPATFVYPANGPITSAFGRRWGRAHTGVDIDAPSGAPILAAQSGVVTFAGWRNGYGRTVMVDHGNGVTTLYAHQAHIGVQEGQRVERGQSVGTVGATGNVTAAHLHYEVIVDGVPRNPTPWL